MDLSSLDLGRAGEDFTVALLGSKGFVASKLRVNAPTYDLEVVRGSSRFFVSVKVSREKQHVRLGSRRSVLNLTQGNFVFAYMPPVGARIDGFPSPYVLLILPAEIARDEALSIHDRYWINKSKDPNTFSVMVKGYGSHHREMWPRWLSYQEAWGLLP